MRKHDFLEEEEEDGVRPASEKTAILTHTHRRRRHNNVLPARVCTTDIKGHALRGSLAFVEVVGGHGLTVASLTVVSDKTMQTLLEALREPPRRAGCICPEKLAKASGKK